MSGGTSTMLGDVAAFIRGITFKPENVVPVGSAGSVACMRTKNVQAELDLSNVWGISTSFVKRTDQYLQPGDILVSSANSWNLVGKCCRVPELPWQSTFGGFISVLRPDKRKIDPRYLYRWFASNRTQATVRSFGQQTTNISNLNIDRCLKLKMRLPTLLEQREIATVLDKADALRAKRSDTISQLESLSQSLFIDLFGDPIANKKKWLLMPLGDVAREKPNNGIFRKNHEYTEHGGGGLPVVWVGELFVGDSIDATNSRRLVPGKQDLKTYGLKRGDILFCRSSLKLDGIAYNNLYSGDDDEALFECHLIRLSPNLELIDPIFLNCLLRLPQMRAVAKSKAKTATMTTIDQVGLCSIAIPVPPIEMQRKFASLHSTIRGHKVLRHKALVQLDALASSLQQQAFRGGL